MEVSILGIVYSYDRSVHSWVSTKRSHCGHKLEKCIFHSSPIIKDGYNWDDDNGLENNKQFPPLYGFWQENNECYDTCHMGSKCNFGNFQEESSRVKELSIELNNMKKELYRIDQSIKDQSRKLDENNLYYVILNEAIIEAEKLLDGSPKSQKIYDRMNKLKENYVKSTSEEAINNLSLHYTQIEQSINVMVSSIKTHLKEIVIILCENIQSRSQDIDEIRSFLEKYIDIIPTSEYEQIYTASFQQKISTGKAKIIPSIIKIQK